MPDSNDGQTAFGGDDLKENLFCLFTCLVHIYRLISSAVLLNLISMFAYLQSCYFFAPRAWQRSVMLTPVTDFPAAAAKLTDEVGPCASIHVSGRPDDFEPIKLRQRERNSTRREKQLMISFSDCRSPFIVLFCAETVGAEAEHLLQVLHQQAVQRTGRGYGEARTAVSTWALLVQLEHSALLNIYIYSKHKARRAFRIWLKGANSMRRQQKAETIPRHCTAFHGKYTF